jgi:uncharacterized membrane protein
MSTYLVLKLIHILSSTVLFGTGMGIAYFKWITDRSDDVRAIRIVSERTVLADWVFTTPAVIVQPITGLALAQMTGYPLRAPWILWSLSLYLLAGACWLPVVWLQIRMRELARRADEAGTRLPERYRELSVIWMWLGVPAFSALIVVYWLMVARPSP